MPNDPRLIGFAASSHSELFPSPRLSTCFVRPFPRDLLRPRAHPLSPSPLQSSFASSPRSSPFGASFTCLGFWPSSRHHPCAATSLRRLPSPSLRDVLRFSQPLDALLRTRACRLISSRCHVQDPPVQGLLSPRSHPSSSEGSFPLAVVPPRAHRLSPAAARFGPRLRGLHPREVAFAAARLFTAPHAAPLLGFFSSRSSLHSVDRSLPTISALDVSLTAPSLFAIARRARPQRLHPERSLASRLRTAHLLELSSLLPNLRARDPDSPPVALR